MLFPSYFFPILSCAIALSGARKPVPMNVAVADCRVTRRHSFKAPLRARIWKSAIPEQRAESENFSEKEILFATDSPFRVGTTVETVRKMPDEITGEATTEGCAQDTWCVSSQSTPCMANLALVCSLTAIRFHAETA